MFLYLCENLGGALFHFFEMSLLKFFQPHPVALEESRLLHKTEALTLFDFFFFNKKGNIIPSLLQVL